MAVTKESSTGAEVRKGVYMSSNSKKPKAFLCVSREGDRCSRARNLRESDRFGRWTSLSLCNPSSHEGPVEAAFIVAKIMKARGTGAKKTR